MNEQLLLEPPPASRRALPGRARPAHRPVQADRLADADQPRAAPGWSARPACAPARPVRPRCCTRSGRRPGSCWRLDVGSQFLRGAVCDLAGTRALQTGDRGRRDDRRGPGRPSCPGSRRSCGPRPASALATADPDRARQPRRLRPAPRRPHPRRRPAGLGRAGTCSRELRATFGASLMIENDVDAAALAERAHGHGRDVDSFAFVSVGTGIGMGLVLDGTAAARSARRGRRDRLPAP